MEIKGKVHCFFEQSGTFKKAFIERGIPAEDYDIQNNFNETDHIGDLFQAIEDAYEDKPSLFDNISKDDLIIAFFPCIYFSCMSQMLFSFTHRNYRLWDYKKKTEAILERSKNREYFFSLAVKLHSVCHQRGIRMIMENPWSEQTFLKANFVSKPSIVDNNRLLRGDYFRKPTAYWFVECEPTYGETYMPRKAEKNICQKKSSGQAGLCSEERSMISPEYARNFINDFIFGKEIIKKEEEKVELEDTFEEELW